MEMRFAGQEADLAGLIEQELANQLLLEMEAKGWNQERERLREIMRLRLDQLVSGGWVSGAEGWEGLA
jgi:hypothetical protein